MDEKYATNTFVYENSHNNLGDDHRRFISLSN